MNTWYSVRMGAMEVVKHKGDIGETVKFSSMEPITWDNLDAEAVSAMERLLVETLSKLVDLGEAKNATRKPPSA